MLLLSAFLILITVAVTYGGTLSAPFIFDDIRWIVQNPYVRDFSPFWEAVLGTTGRPLVAFSFFLNQGLGGWDVAGFHLTNILIHALSGLTLFGILRRTFLSPALTSRFPGRISFLPLAIALVWVVHPLHTQSVTYIIQRGESLMGLFYLATLYFFILGSGDSNRLTGTAGYGLSIAACALGMVTKQVMVTAPLMVVLYDRIFVAASFKEILKKRAWFYAGLFATWLLLLALMFLGPVYHKTPSAGFDFEEFSGIDYALSQPTVILYYLKQIFWPHPLVFDYHWPVAKTWGDVIPSASGLIVLLGAVIWALRFRAPVGFLGVWYFLILLPTSSVLPIADLAVEHRLYLPSIAPIVLAVTVCFRILGRFLGPLFILIMMGVLGWSTIQRNQLYTNETGLWKDTLAKRPENYRAHYVLGRIYDQEGQYDLALTHYKKSVAIRPDFADGYNNLGITHFNQDEFDQAEKYYRHALKLKPDFAKAHNNLGLLFAKQKKYPQALAAYQKALEIDPKLAIAYSNLGKISDEQGRPQEAIDYFRQAFQTDPYDPYNRQRLVLMLTGQDQLTEAAEVYVEGSGLSLPTAAQHYQVGQYLIDEEEHEAALKHFHEVVRHAPEHSQAHNSIGVILAMQGKVSEAVPYFQKAVSLDPANEDARWNLARAVEQT